MDKSLNDYIILMRERYARRTGKPARSLLLNEFCETTQFERKHAIKVLGGQRRKPSSNRRGAKPTYTEADIAILKGIWFIAGQPCGKRLAGEMLELWLLSWEKHHQRIKSAQRKRILTISASHIDRLLAPYRFQSRKRRIGNPSLAALQKEIAVRCEPWQETLPGALEIDTVALCGGSMSGAIVWALDCTDIFSGWTEVRAVWNRGAHATCEGFADTENALPFELRSVDFDNGTEFLNAHFITYFRNREPPVTLTRSRPYHKNDNAHIEQKNYTHVRQLLGDDRFDQYELVAPLNALLKLWSLWNNLYGAQRRLLKKERAPDGKVKRIHEKKAATPCTRLLNHPNHTLSQRQHLENLRKKHDPIDLRQEIETHMKALYELRASLQQARLDEDTLDQEEATTPPNQADAKSSSQSNTRSHHEPR
jgi:hypothetical protein